MKSFSVDCNMGWHEGLWVNIYKRLEVQEVKMVN